MSPTILTPEQLFAELPQQTFDDYGTFERAFVDRFNAHRFEFPTGYGWRDALSWGLHRDLVRREGSRVVVMIGRPRL